MTHSDKTIPYRLSPAELENLRMLRRKTNRTGHIQVDKVEQETDSRNPDPDGSNQKAEKKIP